MTTKQINELLRESAPPIDESDLITAQDAEEQYPGLRHNTVNQWNFRGHLEARGRRPGPGRGGVLLFSRGEIENLLRLKGWISEDDGSWKRPNS